MVGLVEGSRFGSVIWPRIGRGVEFLLGLRWLLKAPGSGLCHGPGGGSW